MLDDEVPALQVAEVVKAVPQDLIESCRKSPEVRVEVTDPSHLRSPLRPCGERHSERTGQRAQEEEATIHYSIT
jgi:hypothetical protein